MPQCGALLRFRSVALLTGHRTCASCFRDAGPALIPKPASHPAGFGPCNRCTRVRAHVRASSCMHAFACACLRVVARVRPSAHARMYLLPPCCYSQLGAFRLLHAARKMQITPALLFESRSVKHRRTWTREHIVGESYGGERNAAPRNFGDLPAVFIGAQHLIHGHKAFVGARY